MLSWLWEIARADQRNLMSAAVVLCIVTALIIYEYYRWSLRVAGFRGPRGVPIYGNLLQISGQDAAQQYQAWSRSYGPVVQVQLGNIPFLVMNTAAAARQILAGHQSATASRPEMYTFHKVVSKGTAVTIGASPHSDSLKRRRKVFATALNKPSVARHTPFIDLETKQLLKDALIAGEAGKKPVNPVPLLLRLNMSLGFTLHWGSRIQTEDALFPEIVEVENAISNSRSTTSNWQDYIPLLRLLPFRGISAQARNIGARRQSYMARLDSDLDQRIEEGTYKPCIRADAKLDPDGKLSADELTSLNVTMTAAGLDTMQSTLSWCLAVLAMRPEIQEKALQAIRTKYSAFEPLCNAADEQSIDYIMAIIRETTRFYPATRLSLPRLTLADIQYDGKIIPKGTILLLNAWACNTDTTIWSDPMVFRPERWLEQPEAPTFTFGLGSRMCIGIHLANRELYVLLTRLINSFRIESLSYIETDPVKGVLSKTATVSMPRPFQVKFIPREPAILKTALLT